MKNWPWRVGLLAVVIVLVGGCGGEDLEEKARLEAEQAAARQAAREAAEAQPGDDALRPLLYYMPEQTHIALAIPSVNAVETELAPAIKAGGKDANRRYRSLVAQLATSAGTSRAKKLAQVAEGIGLDPDAPMAVFIQYYGTYEPDVAAVLTVKDKEKARAALDTLEAKAGQAVAIIDGGRALLSNSPAMLDAMTARKDFPATVAYGRGDYPGAGTNQAVALVRLQDAVGSLPYDKDGVLPHLRPALEYFAKSCDELVFTLSLGAKNTTLRMAVHDTAETPGPEAAPLKLIKAMPVSAPVSLNLRLSDGFYDFVGAMVDGYVQKEELRTRIKSQMNATVKPNFGDEAAVALLGIHDGIPQTVGVLPIANITPIRIFLSLLGAAGEPKETYNGLNLYFVGRHALLNVDLNMHLATSDDLVVWGSTPEQVKAAIDAVKNDEGAMPVGAKAHKAGTHGLMRVLGGRLRDVLRETEHVHVPEKLRLGGARATLALGSRASWHQAELSLPEALAYAAGNYFKTGKVPTPGKERQSAKKKSAPEPSGKDEAPVATEEAPAAAEEPPAPAEEAPAPAEEPAAPAEEAPAPTEEPAAAAEEAPAPAEEPAAPAEEAPAATEEPAPQTQ